MCRVGDSHPRLPAAPAYQGSALLYARQALAPLLGGTIYKGVTLPPDIPLITAHLRVDIPSHLVQNSLIQSCLPTV